MLDLVKFVPNKTLTGLSMVAKIRKKTLKLEAFKNKEYPLSSIVIKRFINPRETFWISLGLYEAEKSKVLYLSKGMVGSKVAFTNQNPQILSNILNMFEILGIKRTVWNGEIGANIQFISDIKEFENKATKYWAQILKLPKKNLRYFKYDSRKPKRTYRYGKEFYGTLTLRYYNVCLNSFLDFFIKKFLK